MRPSFLKRIRSVRGLLISVLVFAVVIVLIAVLMGGFESRSSDSQLTMVRDATMRAALTCYAIEGYYPQSVKYLKENYGLAYDDDRYVIDYDAFASNIMPGIRVIERGAEED